MQTAIDAAAVATSAAVGRSGSRSSCRRAVTDERHRAPFAGRERIADVAMGRNGRCQQLPEQQQGNEHQSRPGELAPAEGDGSKWAERARGHGLRL
ncbi:MAG: hypothetical protein AMXMBFR59_37140 [Rhodanobacteraceae bacterium]